MTPDARCGDPTRDALAYLTACLDREDGLHAELFTELASTHDGAACFAIGLANLASLLCRELADRTGSAEELVLQELALRLEPLGELG